MLNSLTFLVPTALGCQSVFKRVHTLRTQFNQKGGFLYSWVPFSMQISGFSIAVCFSHHSVPTSRYNKTRLVQSLLGRIHCPSSPLVVSKRAFSNWYMSLQGLTSRLQETRLLRLAYNLLWRTSNTMPPPLKRRNLPCFSLIPVGFSHYGITLHLTPQKWSAFSI